MKVELRDRFVAFAYRSGLDALFYWLNRRAKRIVTFHSVLPKSVMPRGGGLICAAEDNFLNMVDEIGRRFTFSNDLNDPRTCTVTFDDGYLNQLEVAGRLLRERGIPAILFLTRDLLDSDRPLAVDQCIAWAEKVPMEVAENGFGRRFADRVELWQQAVRPLFATDGANRGREALRRLEAIYPVDACLAAFGPTYRKLRFTGVTSELVREFRQCGWVFGHHTYSHFPVKDLSAADARAEMTPPPGMESVLFSFPYGDGGSVSVRDVKAAEDLGYPCAVSNEVARNELSGRWFMPRFMITTSNRYEVHFQLSGLKYFLKYRRLLPRWKV